MPTLIVTGDEDDPCLEPGLLMKRHIPTAGLVVLPWSGHTINIEEPGAFNRALLEFFLRVDEAGRRPARSALARHRHPRLREEVILVTGGAGFVGLNVVEQLRARGDAVLVYDLGAPRIGVAHELGDVMDAQALERAFASTGRGGDASRRHHRRP